MPRIVAPLVAGTTYRRGIFFLLGGVGLLPGVQLGVVFVQMFRDPGIPTALTAILLAVTAVIVGVPPLLRGTRVLEIAAVRTLLDVNLPEPAMRLDRETRLRTALWLALHLLIGGLVGFALLTALPLALIFIAPRFGLGTQLLGPFAALDSVTLTVLGVALLLALGYTVAGLGSLAAVMAPVLLGPSTSERIVALQEQADQLAERNRLARELHDSVGHALTVTTVQAAAASRVLQSDPQFVQRALAAIEETGRAAMEELDQMLRLLRDPGTAAATPQRTLADLPSLLDDAKATGLSVQVTLDGELGELAPAVSREAYRIAQEALTNVTRHAPGSAAQLRVAIAARWVLIELTNPIPVEPIPGEPRPARNGAGLRGMRERVSLVGGRFSAGRRGAHWRVRVQLPAGNPHQARKARLLVDESQPAGKAQPPTDRALPTDKALPMDRALPAAREVEPRVGEAS